MKRRSPRGFQQLRRAWDYLHTSFWFAPALMMLFGVALAAAAAELDRSLIGVNEAPPLIYVSEQATAREILSTILSSLITMASLVFSITMVVLTLAASQFGPRLIRSFMASPQTQIVLGAFVMTIVYSLLTLASVGSRQTDGLSAYGTVSIAILLALVSVALLVLFLHVLARSILSETVISRVGAELDRMIGSLDRMRADADGGAPEEVPPFFDQEATFMGTRRAGYIQAIEYDELADVATDAGVLIVLRVRPGDFVAKDGRWIGVHPASKLTEQLAGRIEKLVLVGRHRTPLQDLEFGIRHLVEIAVRALSPSMNDPYTAISAVNQISSSLAGLMDRALPRAVYKDAQGTMRLNCPQPSYRTLISSGFDQIRQNGDDKPVVMLHLIEAIQRIAEHVQLPEQRNALSSQLELLEPTRIATPADADAIRRRLAMARNALGVAMR